MPSTKPKSLKAGRVCGRQQVRYRFQKQPEIYYCLVALPVSFCSLSLFRFFLSDDKAQHEREELVCISFLFQFFFLSSALNAHVGRGGASTAKKNGVLCGCSLYVCLFGASLAKKGVICGIFFFGYFFVLFVCRVRRPFLLRTHDMVTLWAFRQCFQQTIILKECYNILLTPVFRWRFFACFVAAW